MRTNYQTLLVYLGWFLFACLVAFLSRRNLIKLRSELDILEELKKEDKKIKNRISEITLKRLDDYLNGYSHGKIVFLAKELKRRSLPLSLSNMYSEATKYHFNKKKQWLFERPAPLRTASKSSFFP